MVLRLSRVTFGEFSSLKLIGAWAFRGNSMVEINIPNGFEEICHACFCACETLSRVRFGEFSSLKLIVKWAFSKSNLREVHIPGGVEKLCGGCFSGCGSLSRVTFGESSSLKAIGKSAFWGTGVCEIHILDIVEELRDGCFYDCKSLSCVTFGASPSLKLIGKLAFRGTRISHFRLSGSVRSIDVSSFSGCPLKDFVISDPNHFFEVSDKPLISKDKRVCYGYIGNVMEVIPPDSVEELCEERFSACKTLSCVTFGESSSLKLIGKRAFDKAGLREIHIPDGVKKLPLGDGSRYIWVAKPCREGELERPVIQRKDES